MPHSIFIIEHPHSPSLLWESNPPGCEWRVSRRVFWDAFVPDQLRSVRESLLLAHAVPVTEQATQFFHWLRVNPVSIRTIAILPEKNAQLLQTAAETVDDFLISPFRGEELHNRLNRLLGPRPQSLQEIEEALAGELGLRQLVGQDPEFLKVLTQVSLFGASDAPVLLTGDTGTGKELCAHVIHLLSKRRRGPFIPVDCGALPDHLFENEFFGHARGAFTDARADQRGLAALAHEGTLFMDEIDSLSLSAQGKVLRLLQEHTYRPLGSDKFKETNLRIVVATNRDLEELIRQKSFRADLFFRINVLHIRLPALRERHSDIVLLARHFMEDACRSAGIPKKILSAAALRKLENHNWPGNVRELDNAIQRAVLCTRGQHITACDIDLETSTGVAEMDPEKFRSAKLRAIRRFEHDYVRQMLEKHQGNVTRAALEAGKDRRAFGRLAKKYGIASEAA